MRKARIIFPLLMMLLFALPVQAATEGMEDVWSKETFSVGEGNSANISDEMFEEAPFEEQIFVAYKTE